MLLRDGKKFDIKSVELTRTILQASDSTTRNIEQTGLDIMFQERIKKHLDRETALNSNLKKAYAMIFSTYCSKIIQNRIESHPDYESKIPNDPIELLAAIEGLMHDTIKAKYPFASLTLAMEMLLHVKQQENETLIDFIKRFKASQKRFYITR